jgi:hypothetical protein
MLTVSKGVAGCISLSSKGDNDLGISKHKLHSMEVFEQDIKYSLCLLQGFTTSAIQKNSTHKFTLTQTQYFLFAATQPLDTFEIIFANSSLDLFIKPTNV